MVENCLSPETVQKYIKVKKELDKISGQLTDRQTDRQRQLFYGVKQVSMHVQDLALMLASCN